MASNSGTQASATLTATEEKEPAQNTLKITLKKEKDKAKKIKWTEDTVDNEGLGKKKSKCCCQYKKPRANLDESSDSSSDDECSNCPGHISSSGQ